MSGECAIHHDEKVIALARDNQLSVKIDDGERLCELILPKPTSQKAIGRGRKK